MPLASDMEVLTLEGWRAFSTLQRTARLAVPNPEARTFKFEPVEIDAYQISEEPMVQCRGQHVHYTTTIEHSMHVVHGEKRATIKAADTTATFHLDSLSGYQFCAIEGAKNPQAQLAGFWLGDGYKISANRIGFGLKKDRKKEYLRDILKRLGVDYTERDHTNRPGYRDFVLAIDGAVKEALETYIHDYNALAKNKHINRKALESGDGEVVRALFDALMNSDGHVKQDRPQLQFTSTSNTLHSDFQLLSAMLGRDSHYTNHGLSLSYNPDNNRALEIDAQKCVAKVSGFEGRVYCTKTSNGLMFVRGNAQQFGFVVGCA